MTELAIEPNHEKKRLKMTGTVAAGEHVSVTVVGGAEWIQPNQESEGQTLRLRVLFGGHTVAMFPKPTEVLPLAALEESDGSDDSDTGDEWETSGTGNADAVCELSLNSIQAEKYLRGFGNNCLWILDDPENHTLYGAGEFDVLPWPKLRPVDTPYSLDDYPDFVEEAKAAIAAAQEAIEDAVDEANGIVAHVDAAKTVSETARDVANQAAASAQSQANAAGNAANEAKGYRNTAEEHKNAAAGSATGAANSATAAEQWATGGTGGTPSETNNAKHYAEQAAASAEEAEETLENKADKVASATDGNFAGLDANGNLTDSGKKAGDFAPATNIAKSALASDVQTSLGKADTALQSHQSLAAYVNGGSYDSNAKKILLKHDSTTIAEIDATAFIKDGMVSSVTISGGKLVITFNTDAGQNPIEIPLTDIFNPANYYDTTAADGRFVQKETGKGLSTNDYTTAEKEKLAGVADNANNYTLPTADASTLGGVKVGSNLSIDANGVLSATADAELSDTSQNPVQNKVVKEAIDEKPEIVITDGFDTWDYPRQGNIVEMWDGIENSGRNSHGATAETGWVGVVRGLEIKRWKNNSSRTEYSFPATFEADCVHIRTNDDVSLQNAYLNLFDKDARDALGYGTDDYVYKDMDASNHWAVTTREILRINALGDYSQNIVQWSGAGLGPGGCISIGNNGNLILQAALRYGGNGIYVNLGAAEAGMTLDFAVVYENEPVFVDEVFTNKIAKAKFYVNGELYRTITAAADNYTANMEKKPLISNVSSHYIRGFYLNKNDWQGSPWSPDISFMNLASWNCGLTDAEVAFMHKVDKARFGLEV